MKKLLLFSLLALNIQINAQNVGIGNPTPAEKLDVTGNINVTGTIKANGVDGTANQILMKNSGGLLTWGNICDYKNFKQFFNTGAIQGWVVPAGVTKIMAEIYSGGGGGDGNGTGGNGAGGGGGGYLRALISVTSGENLNIIVGGGGQGGNTTTLATAGGGSAINSISDGISVTGGNGATVSNFGEGANNFIVGSSPIIYNQGHPGTNSYKTYGQSSATDYVTQSFYGNGGDGANCPNSGGKGGYKILVNTTGVIKLGQKGHGYGGGGGGGDISGRDGAPGTVIIYW